jgi:hypothetical protein
MRIAFLWRLRLKPTSNKRAASRSKPWPTAQDCDRAGTRPEHPQLKVVAMVRRTAFGELCRELFGNEPNPEENHQF